MRISDWSSDVCSSDLAAGNILDTQVGMSMASIFDPIQGHQTSLHGQFLSQFAAYLFMASGAFLVFLDLLLTSYTVWPVMSFFPDIKVAGIHLFVGQFSYLMTARSDEHTSELQSLMRISYAVFCLKKKTQQPY